MHDDLLSLLPKVDFTRRSFVATTLISGFTVAAGPVMAQTAIHTDSNGLTAGPVRIPARLPVAGDALHAYRAMPATGTGPFPTILVVQEIFGVHEHIQDICRRFAKLGYLAVAPDLYQRQGDMTKITDLKGAIAIAGKVPDAQVMSDLDDTAAWALANGGDRARLGVTGFCWGGRITWLYAAHNPALKAAVAWYGRILGQHSDLTPKNPIDLAAEIECPVLGLYGAADQGITVDSVHQMEAAMRAAGKPAEFIIYDGAPHAFFADYRPSYRKEAAEDGWKQALAWFRMHGVA